jgi:hypothetical protein
MRWYDMSLSIIIEEKLYRNVIKHLESVPEAKSGKRKKSFLIIKEKLR